MKQIIVAILVPIIFASYSDASVLIHNGFITGTQYNSLSDKRTYLMGVMDGFLMAPIFSGEKINLKWFTNCLEGMDTDQVQAIVDKYMSENPVRWKDTMHTIIYTAFIKVCPNSPYKK